MIAVADCMGCPAVLISSSQPLTSIGLFDSRYLKSSWFECNLQALLSFLA